MPAKSRGSHPLYARLFLDYRSMSVRHAYSLLDFDPRSHFLSPSGDVWGDLSSRRDRPLRLYTLGAGRGADEGAEERREHGAPQSP
jgi:hypothetical protein